jgi:ribonuclease D
MIYSRSITKDEINCLPLLEFHGTIEVIESAERAREVALALLQEKYLGFDTETRPSFTKGQNYQVALLQFATQDKAYLFRLNKIPLLPEITTLLSTENVIKTGVGILDDVKALQKLAPFEARGFVDLSKVAEQQGFTSLGLRALTAIFLGKRLTKGAKLTNWNHPRLTPAQLSYAALDASVGLKIYERLVLEL